MKTYVTHYTPLYKRKQSIIEQFGKDVEFVENEPETFEKFRDIKKSEISLFVKHLEIFKKSELCIVLEDDVIKNEGYERDLQLCLDTLPEKWDVIFPGACAGIRSPLGHHKSKQTRGLGMYILNKGVGQKILNFFEKAAVINQPIDHWMNTLPLDYYLYEPLLVSQGSEIGVFPSAIRGPQKILYYFTIGFDKTFVKCLELAIETLRRYSSQTIVALVDEDIDVDLPGVIVYKCKKSKTPEESSMRKLDIFNYPIIYSFDKVLFIDSDIVTHCDIDSIVLKISDPEKLYVYTEDFPGGHTHLYFSLCNYTSEQLASLKDVGVFNAGLFGFIPSECMKKHFDGVKELIQKHTGKFYYEQSFMNVYFNLIPNSTDRNLFTDENYRMGHVKDQSYENKLIHFAGSGSGGTFKYNNMKKYVDTYMCREFNTRVDMITNLVEPNGVIGEIGVFKCDFSRQLVNILKPSRLVLFDLFEGPMCSGDVDGNNVQWCNMGEMYFEAKKIGEAIKGDSSECLSKFEDQTFDMLYIDGDHSYQGVKKDLEQAFKKVKIGGWIMGHDYEMNMNKARTSYDFGVKRAVDEFCKEKGQSIYAKGFDGCVSFAIKKA